MVEEDPFIQIDDLTFQYGGSSPVLRNLSARFNAAATVLLCGANGAGKSTLLKLLVGLIEPQKGEIVVGGIRPRETPTYTMARYLGVSIQTAEHQLFSTTVRGEISFGPANLGRPNADELVENALKLFSLTEQAHRHPYDLHASERKLVSLASTVAMDSPFYLFDEPTAGLGKPERSRFSNALDDLKKGGRGYILITHDSAFAFQHCDRIAILNAGRFVVDEQLSNFLLRPDAQAIVKRADVQMPASARLSRLFDQRPVATTTPDFVSHFRKGPHDH